MSLVSCVVSPEDLRRSVFTLTGDSFHHLFRVRRFDSGDRLRLVDGRGSARWASVERVERGRAELRLGTAAPSNEPVAELHLWVAPIRVQRAAWLVEKATEIGVRSVRWLATERSGREMTSVRIGRLYRVATAAVEQCHRARVPEIGSIGWSEAMQKLAGEGSVICLDSVAGGRPMESPRRERTTILIGPEGGWSDGERDELAEVGAVAVSLGSRTLRTETAAVVAAGLVLSAASSAR